VAEGPGGQAGGGRRAGFFAAWDRAAGMGGAGGEGGCERREGNAGAEGADGGAERPEEGAGQTEAVTGVKAGEDGVGGQALGGAGRAVRGAEDQPGEEFEDHDAQEVNRPLERVGRAEREILIAGVGHGWNISRT
jgi:hypothetical protein